MPYHCYSTSRAPSGSPGSNGNPAADGAPGAEAQNGTLKLAAHSKEGYGQCFSKSFYGMLLHEAELDYLNSRHEECVEKLKWLDQQLASSNYFEIEALDCEISEKTPKNDPMVHANIQLRVRTLLIQLGQGLDYYGHRPDFVPLTSISIYEEAIDQLLLLASDIEAADKEYRQQTQDALKTRKAVSAAVNTLQTEVSQLEIQNGQILIEIDQHRKQIADLLVEEIELENKVAEAKVGFQEAVSREAACGFGDVVKAAGAVAAIASGAGIVVGGASALAAANDYIEKKKIQNDLKEKASYYVKQFKVVKGGLDKISDGYSSVKGILDEERDGAKLIMAEGDFEASVAKFEHLPEAREYRRLMRQYLSVIKTRNNMILQVDGKVTQALQIGAQVEAIENDVANTKGRLLQVFNPRLAEYEVFFEAATLRIRTNLLRAIYMAYRAMEYWSLRKNLLPNDLQDHAVNQLKVYNADFKVKLLGLMEERNNHPNEVILPELKFSRETHPESFDLFEKTGAFSFVFSEDEPGVRAFARVLAEKAEVVISTSEDLNGWSTVVLRHLGDPVFVTRLGEKVSFVHRGRQPFGQIEPGGRRTDIALGGLEGKYAFLSPFATWTFKMIFQDGNKESLDAPVQASWRTSVQEVRITFKGRAETRL